MRKCLYVNVALTLLSPQESHFQLDFFLVGILFMNFDLEISFLFLGVWFIIKLDYLGV